MAKSKLSKHILEMKRTAVRVQKEESQEEQKRLVDDEHWVLDVESLNLKEKESKYIFEASYVPCEELLQFGRMSFQGFNPEIERIHQTASTEESLERSEAREQESGVGDEEMAKRYQSYVATINKKFKRKRERSQIKDIEEEDDDDMTEAQYVKKHKQKREQSKITDVQQEAEDEDDAEARCRRLLADIKKSRQNKFLKPSDE